MTAKTPAGFRGGEARNPAGPRCDWAGCTRRDTVPADEWHFCLPHLTEHVELSRPVSESGRHLAECGTRSAYRRHLKDGENCDVCRTANSERTQARKERLLAAAQAAVIEFDHAAVVRACRGEAVFLTRTEKIEAVRELLRQGYGYAHISKTLRLSGHTTGTLLRQVRAA